MSSISRRIMLGAATAGGILGAALDGQEREGQAVTPPQNSPLAAQNQDAGVPPLSDHGDIPAFKYSFSLAHKRMEEAGWARQVTVRDFPISREMAGVNMRLGPGGVRELHWHLPAEWAYMLYGTARITGVDQNGRGFVKDVKRGDTWYFPTGIPHSIQGLGADGCEFLLVFDDGAFSEFDTFQITDWVTHTSREALSKNFGVPVSAFNKIPNREKFIFYAPLPAAFAIEQKQATESTGEVPFPYSFELLGQSPVKRTKGGEVRIADSSNFKASTTIAAALVNVHPGGMRELHWHPNADEWQYYIGGKGRMTIFAAAGRARTMDFTAGDVGYVPRSMGHFVENTGETDLQFLEMFRTSHYMDVSLSDWMAHTPVELVAAHLNLDKSMLEGLPRQKPVITPA